MLSLFPQVPANVTQGGNLTLSFSGSSPLPPLLNAVFVHSAPGSIPTAAPAPAPAAVAPSPQTLPAVAPAAATPTTAVASTPALAPSASGPSSTPATSAFGFLAPAQAGALPSGEASRIVLICDTRYHVGNFVMVCECLVTTPLFSQSLK